MNGRVTGTGNPAFNPPGTRLDTTQPLYIGRLTRPSGPMNFNGAIDDVRSYDRVLNPLEILDPPNTGTIGWWQLDEQAAAPPGVWAAGQGVAVSSVAIKEFTILAEQVVGGGTAATGYVQLGRQSTVFGDFYLEGPVSCLRVVGNRAYLGMTIAVGQGTAAG